MIQEAEVEARTVVLFEESRQVTFQRTDRMFAYLLLGEWAFGVLIAVFLSPYAWAGKTHDIHAHVYVASLLGGVIVGFPVYLAFKRPGRASTRYAIACAQMLWSALLIHLTGGRIETHFMIFGSLAFLAFYRDWRMLVPATVVIAADHLARQMLWPESIFGEINPEAWRFLEHAFWVVFEDIFLTLSCIAAMKEMRLVAFQRAELEALSALETEKSRALDGALSELKRSSELLVRTEKLAAVGQLAASVGHELRNPLAAVQNASVYVAKRLKAGAHDDVRIPAFLDIVERELGNCGKIISDLLDFARERPLTRVPCPLRALVDEAIRVLPANSVKIVNEVPEGLPVPELDRGQFRQVLLNLVQNAVEAIPVGRAGQVVVRADGGGDSPWSLVIEDDGVGIAPDVAEKIFEPLFTTKPKGTGLGLAIVSNMVKRHEGRIRVQSDVGRGTRFLIDLPSKAGTGLNVEGGTHAA